MIKYYKKESNKKLIALCYFKIEGNNWYFQQGWGFTDREVDYDPTYMIEIDLDEFKDIVEDKQVDLSLGEYDAPREV